MSRTLRFLVIATGFALAANAGAEPTAYVVEAEFLAALSALGLPVTHEGFESAAWDGVRSSIVDGAHTAPSVSSNGLVWSANNLSSEITTGVGAALSGQYGVYSNPHGSYENPDPGADCYTPGECGDGFRGVAENGILYAIGGWVETNTPYAKLGLYLGDYPTNPIDFGETCDPPESENCVSHSTIGTQSQFFGVIDPAGFDRFEFRELEGKLEIGGGDIKLIFADDFRFSLGEPELVFKDGFE
ncbi:hypothetical protein [Elongatibacter sediminis]|uniref:Uncharacterized protein n=1 Tax=Elongatibacter sediminis TaxID=3119006 RepID=A0AAW9RCC4_9GAMM